MGCRSSLLARADSVAKLAAASSVEAARSGRLTSDVVEAIRASGLAGLGLPAALGGLASPPETTVEVLERIAIGDAAAAWIVMVASTTATSGAFLPRASAELVFSRGPSSLVVGVFAPKGKGTPEPAGVRLSGWWPFCSGSLHADWMNGGFTIGEDPAVHTAFFPAAEATVVDSWHVMGLEGTGSNDIRVDDLFVPHDLVTSLGSTPPWTDEPLYRFPVFGLLATGVAAVSLGIARGAIDDLVELAGGKIPTGSRRVLAERPAVQEAVARSEATLGAARAYLREQCASAWAKAAEGNEIDEIARAHLRMAASLAVNTAAEVVDAMFRAGGGTTIYRRCSLEQRFRDIHAAAQHMMVAQPTWEVAGRTLLGVGGHTHL